MAKDEYIKNLMNNLRPTSLNQKKESQEEKAQNISRNINGVLEEIRELKIEGDKKRLIKIHDKNEDILKVLNPVFSVDVTRFVNFLLAKFFEEHPELIKEIKKSFKNL